MRSTLFLLSLIVLLCALLVGCRAPTATVSRFSLPESAGLGFGLKRAVSCAGKGTEIMTANNIADRMECM